VPHYEWVREQFDVLEPFDDVVLSYEVGATKPSTTIFERALEVIKCEPHECFYTDDIEAYVRRGREFGLQAEAFTETDVFLQHLARHGVNLNPAQRPGDRETGVQKLPLE
jgi:putative hydrolase of the HAD superfamily